MDGSFLQEHKVEALFREYMDKLPRRRKRPGSNYVFSASGATEYKANEAVQLITIKTGLGKREVIQMLARQDVQQIKNMASHDYDYYVALSDVEKDG